MEAKELRIGNLVLHKGEVWSYRNDEALSNSFEFTWLESDWYAIGQCTLSLDDIEAIPLTDEWLVNLGFSRVSGWDDYVGWKKGEVEIEEIEPNKKYNNYLDLEINYLHELQNLYFALTKKELTL